MTSSSVTTRYAPSDVIPSNRTSSCPGDKKGSASSSVQYRNRPCSGSCSARNLHSDTMPSDQINFPRPSYDTSRLSSAIHSLPHIAPIDGDEHPGKYRLPHSKRRKGLTPP